MEKVENLLNKLPRLALALLLACALCLAPLGLAGCSSDDASEGSAAEEADDGDEEEESDEEDSDSDDDEDDEDAEEAEDTQTVGDGTFTIEVPAEWTVEETDADEDENYDTVFNIYSDDNMEAVVFQTGISVSGSMSLDYLLYVLEESFGLDSETLEQTTLDGGAVVCRYDYENDDDGTEGFFETVVSGDTSAVIYAICDDDYIRDYADEFKEILDSLVVTDPAEPDFSGSTSTSMIITSLSSFSTFEAETVEGSGEGEVELPATGVPMLLTFEYDGTGTFAVYTIDDDGEAVGQLIGTTGEYSGTVTDYLDYSDVVGIHVVADGDWTATFSPMSSMGELANGSEHEGDAVLYIEADEVDGLEIENEGTGTFAVVGIGLEDAGVLVDSEGDYDDEVDWTEEDSFLIVMSAGTWSISW